MARGQVPTNRWPQEMEDYFKQWVSPHGTLLDRNKYIIQQMALRFPDRPLTRFALIAKARRYHETKARDNDRETSLSLSAQHKYPVRVG